VIKITTVEQARALPEVRGAFWDERRRILDQDELGVGRRGDTVIERVVRPFVPTPTDGDQILWFFDADGRRMQVVYTQDGPAKCELRL
jgi:hypothetical protein